MPKLADNLIYFHSKKDGGKDILYPDYCPIPMELLEEFFDNFVFIQAKKASKNIWDKHAKELCSCYKKFVDDVCGLVPKEKEMDNQEVLLGKKHAYKLANFISDISSSSYCVHH